MPSKSQQYPDITITDWSEWGQEMVRKLLAQTGQLQTSGKLDSVSSQFSAQVARPIQGIVDQDQISSAGEHRQVQSASTDLPRSFRRELSAVLYAFDPSQQYLTNPESNHTQQTIGDAVIALQQILQDAGQSSLVPQRMAELVGAGTGSGSGYPEERRGHRDR